jgi:hypothetical protein
VLIEPADRELGDWLATVERVADAVPDLLG